MLRFMRSAGKKSIRIEVKSKIELAGKLPESANTLLRDKPDNLYWESFILGQ